jgi:hypothetical protein
MRYASITLDPSQMLDGPCGDPKEAPGGSSTFDSNVMRYVHFARRHAA